MTDPRWWLRRIKGAAVDVPLRIEAALRVGRFNREARRHPRADLAGVADGHIPLPPGHRPAAAVIRTYGYRTEVKEREWDDLAVHDGTPGQAVLEDLLCHPSGDDMPQSGLYRPDATPVPETIVHRGLTRMNGHAHLPPWSPGELGRAGIATEDRPAIYIGHVSSFGHFLTETLSRLWIRDASGLDDPIWVHHGKDPYEHRWGADLLRMAGIPRDRLVRYDAPTRLRRVVVPRPALVLNAAIWTVFPEFSGRLGLGLIGGPPPRTEQPLYLSRQRLSPRQRIHGNEAALVTWLKARGARIIHSQKMPLAEQVRAINAHATVIGPVGSAHHLNLLAAAPARHVYFAPSLGPQTYMLVDAAKGNESHWIEAPDLPSIWKQGQSPHLQNTVIDLDLTRRVLQDLGI